MGEAKRRAASRSRKLIPSAAVGPITLDTFAGKLHVEWDPAAAVTPLGQLPFFIEFLKVSGLFERFVAQCPLEYESPNAPSKREVLGTLLLSILAGHHRYAHISSVRMDGVNPGLLGISRVLSEDAIRRALKRLDEAAGVEWLETQLQQVVEPLVSTPWILDIDTTVKPLYGHQQGAVLGYNPHKPGRPSHAYHSYMMGDTRLVMNVEVEAGNRSASTYSAPELWKLLQALRQDQRPAMIRGDIAFGVEPIMAKAEELEIPYLFKLRQTTHVKTLIAQVFRDGYWDSVGQGWEGRASELRLTGWSRTRRVIVMRRLIRDTLRLPEPEERPQQLKFSSISEGGPRPYEYAVLVTSLEYPPLTMAQLYRDRADCENHFDELKNQWGWGGYTTHDLKRCRLISRMVALIYNWWSLFVRLAHPEKHLEAITSRPLLLHAVAKQVEHAGQRYLTITSMHALSAAVQRKLSQLNAFMTQLKESAEQLSAAQLWYRILNHAFRKLLRGRPLRPPPSCLDPAFN
jgi:hypothetical protein